MFNRKLFALGTALGMTASSLASAGEHAVNRSDVPEAVIRAVAARYPSGVLTQFAREVEHGRTAYEVALDVAGSRAELIVTPNGKIELEERVIRPKDLPDAVQKGLASSRFGKAKVIKVERVTKADKVDSATYEIVVESQGKKRELAFNAAGKLLTAHAADEAD